MPDATITSTASTFGTISGTFAADQSTVTGTVTAIIPGTLSGSVGVPGPQGPAGSQGPQGEPGPAGVGVPAGGTTGQALVKTSNTDYATGWTTLNLTQYLEKANNLSDLTNVTTARTNLGLGTMATATATDYLSKAGNLSGLANLTTARNNLGLGATNTVAFQTINLSEGAAEIDDTLTTGTFSTGASGYALSAGTNSYVEGSTSPIVSESGLFFLNKEGFNLQRYPTYDNSNPSSPTTGGELTYTAATGVLTLRAFETSTISDHTTTLGPTGLTLPPSVGSITFGDATVQTTAAFNFDPTGYATESWVTSQGYAPLDAPVFTGDAQAVTAALGDNDTSIATTAFVQQELLSGTANARNLEVYVRNQTGSSIPAGSVVYINGATGNRPTITLAQANNDANSAQTFGFTKTAIANNGFGFVIVRGECENLNTSGLTEGVQLYLSPTTAGAYTTTKPSAPDHLVYVGIVVRAHPTQGVILVAVQNGYELNELHDVAIGTLANNDLLTYESSTDLWKNKTFSALGLLTSADAASTYLTSATAASTYQTLSGMSSYLTTSAAASTYAPLASPTFTGTVTIPAGASISGFAPLASPTFTGTPSLPTGTTAVTQSAGNNTTAVATTAFVQQEVPDFATFTTPTPTSTTTVVSPRIAMDYIMHPGRVDMYGGGYGVTSGTGASVNVGAGTFRTHSLAGPDVGVAGRAGYFFDETFNSYGMYGFTRGALIIQRAWNKAIWASGRCYIGSAVNDTFNGDANSTIRISVGGKSSTAGGDISAIEPGFGWKIPGMGNAMQLQVSNGSAVTTVTSSFTPIARQVFDWKTYSDGAGNVTLWINDVQVATTTGGPSTSTPEAYNYYFEQVEQTASAAVRVAINSLNPRVWWGV